jgi:DNA-binding MarR family transcriptional regulator
MSRARGSRSGSEAAGGLAFLLSQIGAHSAGCFAERLAVLNLAPPHAGILRIISQTEGLSQQSLGEKLGVFPSRLVQMIDELEARGMVDRKDNPADRRSYALILTKAGRESLKHIERIACQVEERVCAALDESERAQLRSLLTRIAEEQQLTPGVHPGFRRLSAPPC